MESLVETSLSNLLQGIEGDPAALSALIVDEIERSLPEIISGLQIPQPLDRSAIQLLEFRLMARKGFRSSTAGDKKKAIKRLTDESFSKVLRKIQQIMSNGAQASTTGRFLWREQDYPELTNQPLPQVNEAETVVRKPFRPITLQSTQQETVDPLNGTVKPDSDTVQQEVISGTFPEDMLAKTTITPQIYNGDILEVPKVPIELQEPLAGRDIRGLIALLRAGRLVAFLDPLASYLIPKGIEKIPVPTKKSYESLKSEDVQSEYHRLVVSETANHSQELSNEFQLLDALLVSLENEAQWSRINRRRFHLISKKYVTGLAPQESEELDALQSLAQKQMYTALELPFAELAMLEEYARNLGFQENS